MIVEDISLLVAFFAGLVSFFTPCILPLIPAYMSYITGVNVIGDESNEHKGLILRRSLGFVLGFTIVFVIMGASSSAIGRIFVVNRVLFARLSGLLIIFFGLKMMGVIKFTFLSMEKKVKLPTQVNNIGGAILMGMAFAAGWTPCFGPVLASILIYAGGLNVTKGIILLLVYSLGMAIPFVLTGVFIGRARKYISKLGSKMVYISRISGIIMVIFGLLIFFDKVIVISGWLLQ